MATESSAVVSFYERRRTAPVLQVSLTPWETSIFDRALYRPHIRPAASTSPASQAQSVQKPLPRHEPRIYESEWVTPDGDGWAPWSAPEATSSGPVYARAVLAVPDGDGWAACDEADDSVDTDLPGHWLEPQQLHRLVRHLSDSPTSIVHAAAVSDTAHSIHKWVEMLRHAMDRGLDVHIAYECQVAL
jgi:hypothetical protein